MKVVRMAVREAAIGACYLSSSPSSHQHSHRRRARTTCCLLFDVIQECREVICAIVIPNPGAEQASWQPVSCNHMLARRKQALAKLFSSISASMVAVGCVGCPQSSLQPRHLATHITMRLVLSAFTSNLLPLLLCVYITSLYLPIVSA